MKKIKNSAGFSLIEMMLALAVLVLLVVGMQSGLDAGVNAYGESMFQSNSAALAGILNSAIADVLRYSENIERNPQYDDPSHEGFFRESDNRHFRKEEVDATFTNYEYNSRKAFLHLGKHRPGSGSAVTGTTDVIQIWTLEEDKDSGVNKVIDLVNTGAYPDLGIVEDSLKIVYYPKSEVPDPVNGPGNYYTVEYTIYDLKKPEREWTSGTTVRVIND